MIKIHLSRLLGERRMKQSDLSRKTGIRANTVSDLSNEYAISISFENLELICTTLGCTISELLELKPNEPETRQKQS